MNDKRSILVGAGIAAATVLAGVCLVLYFGGIEPATPKVLKSETQRVTKLADQEVINLNKRLTNDQLSELSVSDIESRYSKEGQDTINGIFKDQTKAKEYALTLIGKVIPAVSLKTLSGETVPINKQTVLVILNTGDKSKEFVSELNKTTPKDGVTYLALFPANKKDEVSKFLDEVKLKTDIFKPVVAEDNPKTEHQPDLLGMVEFFFNAKGVPSYLSIDTNSITLAGSGRDGELWSRFIETSFQKPYLYNRIEKND